MLDFLRQPGIRDCDIDSVLEEAVARYQLEEELKTYKHGISGLSDLYRTTVDRHGDLKEIMTDTELPASLVDRCATEEVPKKYGYSSIPFGQKKA